MITKHKVRRLMELIQKESSFAEAAAKAGMSEKTARKYRDSGVLPEQSTGARSWQTRADPFEEGWDEIKDLIKINPGLEARTIFDHLQRKYPGKYQDGQVRTLQRKIKHWRAIEGPGKEVYFPQKHIPGRLCQSDFTCMNKLGVTIQKLPFNHLIYHFVLTYSNWEHGTICFSESFESLSSGVQNALWNLGGVPEYHQSDRLSAAVDNKSQPEKFTRRYKGLLSHYGLKGLKIQAGKPNENGDIEQRNYRFKKAVDQALMLRNSRDFEDRKEYEIFLSKLYRQLNFGRQDRLKKELNLLHDLPVKRLEDCKILKAHVGPSSTVRVMNNVYSVHSRLIGEDVTIKLYAENLEIWYGQKCIHIIERLRGQEKHRIDFRHIIDWLVRKPGAFKRYRYQSDLFPCTCFRIAYDELCREDGRHAVSRYLKILLLAAKENQGLVEAGLNTLLNQNQKLRAETIKELLKKNDNISVPEPKVKPVNLTDYNALLPDEQEEAVS